MAKKKSDKLQAVTDADAQPDAGPLPLPPRQCPPSSTRAS